MSAKLKGMTWDHPRGYDPMVATSAIWHEQSGVEISWEKRSLQDFESFPVEQLAKSYDLIVIDHPHVGQITHENCLAPLDVQRKNDERRALAKASVGGSFASYTWQGRQWALPIDAATQVQAYRPDLIGEGVTNWDDLIRLAEAGKVILPLRPPHSLMTFYSLCANLGFPCRNDGQGEFIDPIRGAEAFSRLAQLAQLVDKSQLDIDPIAASELMAEENSSFAVMPYAYGYANYALEGFCAHRLKFTNVPALGNHGVIGSALGGTGIAVSAFGQNIDAAIDYAYWVAGSAIQSTVFAQAGGQPGHADAWADENVNAPVDNFYRDTRATLEGAYVRPRHNGYMEFQQNASKLINQALLEHATPQYVIGELNALFEGSF